VRSGGLAVRVGFVLEFRELSILGMSGRCTISFFSSLFSYGNAST